MALTSSEWEDLLTKTYLINCSKKESKANPKILTKMVEARFDKSPEYFKQLNENFKYFTNPTLPDELIHFSNYVYGFHKEGTGDYCNSSNHYHILVQITSYPCFLNFTVFHVFTRASNISSIAQRGRL